MKNKFNINDLIAYAKINRKFSYGRVFEHTDYIYIKPIYEPSDNKYPYLPNFSSNSKYRYLEVIYKDDAILITNKDKIKEILHLENKLKVFK